MKIPDQRTAIQFRLIGSEGSGTYLSQAPREEALEWLREFYSGRLAAVTFMQPESPTESGEPEQ
jgi:hypothetical protein